MRNRLSYLGCYWLKAFQFVVTVKSDSVVKNSNWCTVNNVQPYLLYECNTSVYAEVRMRFKNYNEREDFQWIATWMLACSSYKIDLVWLQKTWNTAHKWHGLFLWYLHGAFLKLTGIVPKGHYAKIPPFLVPQKKGSHQVWDNVMLRKWWKFSSLDELFP